MPKPENKHLSALIAQADELRSYIEKLRKHADKLDALIEVYRIQNALEEVEKLE